MHNIEYKNNFVVVKIKHAETQILPSVEIQMWCQGGFFTDEREREREGEKGIERGNESWRERERERENLEERDK